MQKIKNSSVYVIYKLCNLLDSSIAKLDPLGLNKFFAKDFPSLSQNGETKKLTEFLTNRILEIGYENIINLDSISAMAAIRDLNMFASSLNRWGIQISEIPMLEEMLVSLSDSTRELPVDTVYTYGPRNPKGENRRFFTTCPEEKMFIDSFVEGMKNLPVCVAGLELLQITEPTNPNYAIIAEEVGSFFSLMVKSIVSVRRNIPAEVFTHQLRPFFDPKIVGGKKYFAPGGAQMPICLMDLILWGIETDDKNYVRYWNESIEYLPLAVRSKIAGIIGKQSIITTLSNISLQSIPESKRAILVKSIEGVIEVLLEMEKFRQPHLRIAEDNMKIRSTGSVGSGGYDSEILGYLLGKTKQARERLQEIILDKNE
jgi:hypothetical protein